MSQETTKRAYVVTLELQYPVVASSEDEARLLAFKSFDNDEDYVDPKHFEVSDLNAIPAGWDLASGVLCSDDDDELTVEEASKLPGGYAYSPPAQRTPNPDETEVTHQS